ncbi:glycosyltransferase family 2 protein [Flavobacterium psychrophilum]|uniref:glycosyltransferase family 2 protein n=1 Tax=Flavobacterium psychrophilum TaxID=96345 RepID=UPI00073F5580|nr:glycosyltransferase family 2 protein [Flavobacterium psychrophilum]ELI6454978.1 glycosyltransferase family 2 protein [Flavobacterium psychrophilum]QZL00324.1 glycosyltransferase family 2 protein [Flavobacterium psychrophilum]SNB38532.1 Glycosyl transferase, group 2 family protein [Flavobacterium psychrophilum]SNB43037.1 Glycosyl transferase, group 2 family protein [Flavobacterium psychrophilum]SNB95501.1 Glycosyl transferase, group 2 family protein [Flavobacterium psychrophilum]
MNKKIFVIIVTYNGSKWIEKCINSLLRSIYPINILVVDNCSTDDSVELLKQFSEIHLIQSKENLGFGKANNIGIDYALNNKADYVFLLNQDTWVFDDTISNLVVMAQNNPSFGIVSPMHFSGDEKTLDKGFVTYYNRNVEENAGKNIAIVPFVNAAAWLVSSACLQKVGGFESLFGHYGEDRNYCDRVLYHQFQIVIAKNAKICHDRKISRSFKKDLIQSKYKMLSQVLDINNTLFASYANALQSVFGLPKYFKQSYSFTFITQLFYNLVVYYLQLIFRMKVIKMTRKKTMI